MAASSPPTTVVIRSPSKYTAATDKPTATFTPPPLAWLYRTWTVTHSTLSMWRSAQNVRITYAPLPAKEGGPARIDDRVEYESNARGKKGVRTIAGVDTAAPAEGAWDWRGRGLLVLVGSHWEVLGWGERPVPGGGEEVERGAVTWFAPTLFTREGVALYSDRPGGMSPELAADIRATLESADVPAPLADMVKKDMQPVDVKLPWQENPKK